MSAVNTDGTFEGSVKSLAGLLLAFPSQRDTVRMIVRLLVKLTDEEPGQAAPVAPKPRPPLVPRVGTRSERLIIVMARDDVLVRHQGQGGNPPRYEMIHSAQAKAQPDAHAI